MSKTFPNDADGDALRGIAQSGSDLSQPMSVDFQVGVPSEAAGAALGKVASQRGYSISVYASPECDLPWTCECTKTMLATYEGVIAAQAELATLAAPFGGRPDGWGTAGNAPAKPAKPWWQFWK